MPTPMSAADVLDRAYLEVRAKLLELAASLDRLDRGEGTVEGDRRMEQFHQALRILDGRDGNRADQIQLVFSLPYQSNWRQILDMRPSL